MLILLGLSQPISIFKRTTTDSLNLNLENGKKKLGYFERHAIKLGTQGHQQYYISRYKLQVLLARWRMDRFAWNCAEHPVLTWPLPGELVHWIFPFNAILM